MWRFLPLVSALTCLFYPGLALELRAGANNTLPEDLIVHGNFPFLDRREKGKLGQVSKQCGKCIMELLEPQRRIHDLIKHGARALDRVAMGKLATPSNRCRSAMMKNLAPPRAHVWGRVHKIHNNIIIQALILTPNTINKLKAASPRLSFVAKFLREALPEDMNSIPSLENLDEFIRFMRQDETGLYDPVIRILDEVLADHWRHVHRSVRSGVKDTVPVWTRLQADPERLSRGGFVLQFLTEDFPDNAEPMNLPSWSDFGEFYGLAKAFK